MRLFFSTLRRWPHTLYNNVDIHTRSDEPSGEHEPRCSPVQAGQTTVRWNLDGGESAQTAAEEKCTFSNTGTCLGQSNVSSCTQHSPDHASQKTKFSDGDICFGIHFHIAHAGTRGNAQLELQMAKIIINM